MKKILTSGTFSIIAIGKCFMLCFFICLATLTFGSANLSKPPLKASEIFLPVGKTGKTISLMDLATISMKDFQLLTGKKMHLIDRLTFKAGQRKLRHSVNPDGTFKKKRIEKFFMKRDEGNGGSGLGGFALGLFLWLIGVLIAYLINDDKKKNRVKWAWIGAAVYTLIAIIIIAAWASAWAWG